MKEKIILHFSLLLSPFGSFDLQYPLQGNQLNTRHATNFWETSAGLGWLCNVLQRTGALEKQGGRNPLETRCPVVANTAHQWAMELHRHVQGPRKAGNRGWTWRHGRACSGAYAGRSVRNRAVQPHQAPSLGRDNHPQRRLISGMTAELTINIILTCQLRFSFSFFFLESTDMSISFKK